MNALRLEVVKGYEGYELLDFGAGRKLERFGDVIVNRPETQALAAPTLPQSEWERAQAVFAASEDEEAGKWSMAGSVPESWTVPILGQVKTVCRLMSFRHMGLFPEQMPHWVWAMDQLKTRPGARVLNLFGYSGAATMLAAAAGAGEIVHVDASKKAIAWGRENQTVSKLDKAPIRWICEDARKFVAREIRRERRYDCLLIDPPKFGRGAEGEVWDFFSDISALLHDCAKITAPNGVVILTSYAVRASALATHDLMRECYPHKILDTGELALAARDGRLLGTSLFTRAF